MRVIVYEEELTERVELFTRTIGGRTITGARFYLELPAIVGGEQHQGPFMQRPGEDDSAAVTFWGKPEYLRTVLRNAVAKLDERCRADSAPC